jgi:hypothetical protein
MGVVSKITKRIDVPSESGQWIEIRMLSWLTLDKARKERLKDIAGMSDVFAAFRTLAANGAIESAKTVADDDPMEAYDKRTLLGHGIAAWSYGDTVNPEDLDEHTADWAARQILAYTVPGEAEVKASSSLSTGT